ncbi:MAG TPA: condensation domain-containing protein, partial [Methylomirabilota bacterium]|nr:condensation domain-containing protein [Methylomirabilota bacterium]
LDRAALAAAFAGIVERHGSLRTTFHSTGGGPVQRVAPYRGFALPAIDLAALPEAVREGELLRLAQADARLPFDLAQGPLFRPVLIALGEGAHALFATMHHIVSDGWSHDLFVGELTTLYQAALERLPSPLPPLPIQYVDYAVWQRGREEEDSFRAALVEWKERLAGAPPALDLPAERPRPPIQTFAGRSLPLRLEAGLTGRLRRLAHAAGATQFMLLLTALGAVFARYTGQTDLVLGAPIAGRTRRETEGLIGFFLNSLALRLDLAGDPPFGEALSRVRETTLAAYAHQEVPIERLLEELKPERDLSRTPLFQVVVNWLAFGQANREPIHLPDLTLAPLSSGDPVAKFDLEVYAGEAEDGIAVNLVYNRDLFAPRQMAALAGHLRAALEAATAEPGRRLSELPLAL